jgi:methionine sulfoxide reductase catalytic subunit
MDKSHDIPSHEITDPDDYVNRRSFMRRAGILAATTIATGWVYRKLNFPPVREVQTRRLANLITSPTAEVGSTSPVMASAFSTNEAKNSLDDITHYNNFYEFSTDKGSVADAAAGFVTQPWSVSVGGLVAKPKIFDLDDLLGIAPPEERVYRMRCVEGWSMVIPWDGFSLSKLLDRVQPLSSAKYVAFQTLLDPSRMPNQQTGVLDWPYVEGLRMDEAMHPLTILASGIYGRELPPQDGAPVRLVVPWKYGFKGIKSIVKITLVADQPPTTWNITAPDEYGFYSNVNPQVDHPRWSQATEQRIGELERRPTLMFNGYADQVGQIYSGMDLRKFF